MIRRLKSIFSLAMGGGGGEVIGIKLFIIYYFRHTTLSNTIHLYIVMPELPFLRVVISKKRLMYLIAPSVQSIIIVSICRTSLAICDDIFTKFY